MALIKRLSKDLADFSRADEDGCRQHWTQEWTRIEFLLQGWLVQGEDALQPRPPLLMGTGVGAFTIEGQGLLRDLC